MEVLKALTREPALTHIRVVVLSSLVNPEKRAAAGSVLFFEPSP